MKTLKELYKHVWTISGRKDEAFETELWKDWHKLCKIYDFQIVLKAWENIKLMDRGKYPDPYFALATWLERCDFHHKNIQLESKMKQHRERPEASPGISYPEIAEAMGLLCNGKITREQFAISCERKGFDMTEYREFLNRKGFDITGYASGLLGKTITIQGGAI